MLWTFNIPHPIRILSLSFVGTLQLSPIRMASFGSRHGALLTMMVNVS